MHCKITASLLFASQVSGLQATALLNRMSGRVADMISPDRVKRRAAEARLAAEQWVSARTWWTQGGCVPKADKLEDTSTKWGDGEKDRVGKLVQQDSSLKTRCVLNGQTREALDKSCLGQWGISDKTRISEVAGKTDLDNAFREVFERYSSEMGTGEFCNNPVWMTTLGEGYTSILGDAENTFRTTAVEFQKVVAEKKFGQCNALDIAVELMMEKHEAMITGLLVAQKTAQNAAQKTAMIVAEGYVAVRKQYIKMGCPEKRWYKDNDVAKDVNDDGRTQLNRNAAPSVNAEDFNKLNSRQVASRYALDGSCFQEIGVDQHAYGGFLGIFGKEGGSASGKDVTALTEAFQAVVDAYSFSFGASGFCQPDGKPELKVAAAAFIENFGGVCHSLTHAVVIMKGRA